MTRRQRLVAILITAFIVAPLRRSLASEWTVTVVDERDAGVAGVGVAQMCTDYTVSHTRTNELRSDAKGEVIFRPVRSWRPVWWWLLATVPELINFHGRSSGVSCRVWIPYDPTGKVHTPPGIGSSAFCSEAACSSATLRSTLPVLTGPGRVGMNIAPRIGRANNRLQPTARALSSQ